MITFEFKPEKFASAVAFLVKQNPGLTKKQICKLMYFADKEHLLRFGRTITGDVYCALPQGHVPMNGLDAINGNRRVGQKAIDCVRKYGHLAGWEFILENGPNMRVFSKTDISVLEAISGRMGHMTAWQLERASHNEPSWRKTEPNQRVAFELFFDGHPEADQVKEAVLEKFSGQTESLEPACAL